MKEEILRLEKITQIVDEMTLLDSLNLHIFKGEIMGLLCINDHGKEALIQLLCQNIPIHYGNVYFLETLVNNYKHSSMGMNQVSVIEKPSHLVQDLSVIDNIFVLRRGVKKYFINTKVLSAQLKQFTDDLGIHIDGNAFISQLTFFEKCVVELLKAFITGVKLVVIRDISNFISQADLKKTNELLDYYSKKGMSFMYICNHHEEAYTICHRVALMENGRVLKVLDKKGFKDDIVLSYTLDFGRKYINNPSKTGQDEIIKFDNISTENLKNISFTVAKGECVVFLDINNTSLSDILKLLNGEVKPLSGEIELSRAKHKYNSSYLKENICFINENPVQTMLFREMSYIDNLCFLIDKKVPALWFNKKIRKSVMLEYEPLAGKDIYAEDIMFISIFSLYNLVYFKIHLYHPKVVVCIQPFSGADMYLRHHIIYLINQLLFKKIAVIILAVSLSDTLVTADRLLIIKQGELVMEYESENFHLFKPH